MQIGRSKSVTSKERAYFKAVAFRALRAQIQT